ncbi:transglutaminase-like cysteine peptidase [Qipengyuania huizhouensis]|uniref:transglutaminase-like cysteine peptidase n=1 Tax=Qipengyuania huizhouensis TaxID=2867245 RepID=UPI001C887043|nr:transglutaminase-like cysteine peptidase [Qipengyuania huizhouensis]MBX7460168.1 transglutaminase-like cysteine peptidase [Qipengyuania huizhouensis]
MAIAPHPAQAATPAIAVQAVEMMTSGCNAPIAANAPISLTPASASKASQIIGGESALDAIRARQAGTAPSHPLFSSAPGKPFEPAAAPLASRSTNCAIEASPFAAANLFQSGRTQFAAPRRDASLLPSGGRKDLVLGSRMVPISRTSFDAQWQRVSARRTNLSATLSRAAGTRENLGQLIASVNRWVNREIEHAEDIDLYGRSDYWADAATTLRLGQGDCEDFALLKMELLAAAGVAREDMILTLARDLVRRRDHAVLLVRTDDGYLMLDNVGSAPLDASQDHGYRPVMSLGAKQSWLHGY